MPTDPLDPILDGAAVEGTRLHYDELAAMSRLASGHPLDEFIEAAVLAPGLEWDDGRTGPVEFFELHGRHWWIDVADARNRTHLITTVVAAALVDALGMDFSTAWVTRVLPSALTVRAASRDVAGLHLRLRRRRVSSLPSHLLDVVNPDDYTEFLASIGDSVGIIRLPAGGTIEITDPEATSH
jgi:hypothetical protein